MRRILVVENEPDLAEALILILRDEGFVVTLSSAIESARIELDRFDPDVVLIDHLLDGETSDAFVSEIFGGRRVVVMSASTSSRALAERHGLSFVAKPFDFEELLPLLV